MCNELDSYIKKILDWSGLEKRFTDQLDILLLKSRYNLSCAVGRAEETKREENLAAFIASERVVTYVRDDVRINRKQVQ
jgi:hypothetical protein